MTKNRRLCRNERTGCKDFAAKMRMAHLFVFFEYPKGETFFFKERLNKPLVDGDIDTAK